jgi:hypothetical protein
MKSWVLDNVAYKALIERTFDLGLFELDVEVRFPTLFVHSFSCLKHLLPSSIIVLVSAAVTRTLYSS